MCHEKTDGYIIRFNEVSELQNRTLHSTQWGAEKTRVNSEGLTKSQPGVGKDNVIPFWGTQRSVKQSPCLPYLLARLWKQYNYK